MPSRSKARSKWLANSDPLSVCMWVSWSGATDLKVLMNSAADFELCEVNPYAKANLLSTSRAVSIYRFVPSTNRTTVSAFTREPSWWVPRNFFLYTLAISWCLPVRPLNESGRGSGRTPCLFRSPSIRPTVEKERSATLSSLRRIASFSLPILGSKKRSRTIVSFTTSGTIRLRLLVGAVLFGSRASRCPCFAFNICFHLKRVGRDTSNASFVASSPCSCQNDKAFTLLSTSCLFLILRNRIVLSHILNQPRVPLNILNCFMFRS